MALRIFPYLSPRIIQVQAPITEISVQDLSDQVKDWEDEPSNLTYPILIKTFGKQALGGGVLVGITAELQNAKIAFQARDGTDIPAEVLCTVSGGNLVAVDSNGVSMNPVSPTAYTQVVIAQSSSATIATPPSDTHLMYLIESLRGRHASIGNVYYWNPTSGNNSNAGTTPATAVLSFSAAQALCSAGNNDVIFALSTDSDGITTVTETININVPTLKLRGPGYPFQFVPITSGSPTITVSADSVEVSGFYVGAAAGGTDNGITVTGDNALIKDVWVKSATGDGINISSSTRSRIDTCAVESCTGNGITIGASTSLATVKQCIISGSGSDGVELIGASINDNILENNIIYNNTGYGVKIGSGVTRTGVRLHNTFSGNLSATNDAGTSTFIDSGGAVTSTDIENIVDGVWDELLSAHSTSGSAGKTLKDAKTKATLASLK